MFDDDDETWDYGEYVVDEDDYENNPSYQKSKDKY